MTPAFAAALALADPASPLADFLGAIGNVLHRLLALPVQASTFAAQVDALQYVEFVVFWILGFITIGATTLFVVRFRRRATDPVAPRTRKVQAPLWLEGGVAFSMLALFMTWWMVGFGQYASRQDPPDDALTVYAVGKQWVWKFSYEDGPQSVGILYLPKDRPVKVVTASRDVIHSFFVPAFRIKMDAVPGRYNTTWFQPNRLGTFRIMCAEYCGSGHGSMWSQAVVLPAEEFDRWLEGYEPAASRSRTAGAPAVITPGGESDAEPTTMAERGLRIAARHGCLQCHSTDGTRQMGPTWRGLYGARVPLQSGDTVVADPGYLTESMMDPEARVVEGFDPVMPTFQGLLSQAEAAALVEYIKSIGRSP